MLTTSAVSLDYSSQERLAHAVYCCELTSSTTHLKKTIQHNVTYTTSYLSIYQVYNMLLFGFCGHE